MRSWKDDLRDQLKRHEGWVSTAYQDHLGYLTIGYGRLIDKNRNGGISLQEGEMLLQNDIDKVVEELNNRIDWFHRLPPRKKQALSNMAFQLGVNGLFNFRRMLNAVRNRQWSPARIDALDYK